MRYLFATLLSILAIALDAVDQQPAVGLGPLPPRVSVYGSGGAAPATGQVVYSNGTNLLGDAGFTRTANTLTLDSGSDNVYTFGNASLGFLATASAGDALFYPRGGAITGPYFRARANGSTVINCSTGGTVAVRINNTDVLSIAAATATLVSGTKLAVADSTGTSSTATGCATYGGGIGIGGGWYAGGQCTASSTVASVSVTTGAVTVGGGISAGKNVICGQQLAGGVTTTATAAGTTTLTTSSTRVQIFTGSTTQTVTLPAANAFGAGVGIEFVLCNRSTGSVSWARAGSDTINGATSNVAVATVTTGMIFSDGVSAWYTK